MEIDQPGLEPALRFVTKLAEELTAALSFPDFIDYLLQSLKDEVGLESCTIALTDEHRPDVLTVVGASGLQRCCRGLEIPRPEGFHWLVMTTQESLTVPDTHEDPRSFQRYEHVRSAIFAPLAAKHRIIGVLGAYANHTSAFTGDDLRLLTAVARFMASAIEVARLHEASLDLAVTDAVTELPTRRRFLSILDRELARSQRSGLPLSLVLLDLDGFKVLNDRYGHLEGDAILGQVAADLRRRLRRSDVLARFGGDEFALLCPETSPTDVQTVLERMATITMAVGPERRETSISFSWGTASSPGDATEAAALLCTADVRLYEMKRAKRGRDEAPIALEASSAD